MEPRLERVLIVGTGLLGASTGLALRAVGFSGCIAGWDKDARQLQTALERGAIQQAAQSMEDAISLVRESDLILLCGPVFAILDWMEKLAGETHPGQLVTDVGSTKAQITASAEHLFAGQDRAVFLPGHPMAGKEIRGAEAAEATLFRGAYWIFTPTAVLQPAPDAITNSWHEWVKRIGAVPTEMDATQHDTLLAWTSHLPQMVATALAAELQTRLGDDPARRQIGGRALREMTRLGASPFSMWRDIAATNTEALTAALLAMEQRLAHMRENLRTPELREEFEQANRFRSS